MALHKLVIDFELAKNAANRIKHGLPLADSQGFDSVPVELIDRRRDYGEERVRAFGRVNGQPFCLVYTARGPAIRLIGLRRASEREMRLHGA